MSELRKGQRVCSLNTGFEGEIKTLGSSDVDVFFDLAEVTNDDGSSRWFPRAELELVMDNVILPSTLKRGQLVEFAWAVMRKGVVIDVREKDASVYSNGTTYSMTDKSADAVRIRVLDETGVEIARRFDAAKTEMEEAEIAYEKYLHTAR